MRHGDRDEQDEPCKQEQAHDRRAAALRRVAAPSGRRREVDPAGRRRQVALARQPEQRFEPEPAPACKRRHCGAGVEAR